MFFTLGAAVRQAWDRSSHGAEEGHAEDAGRTEPAAPPRSFASVPASASASASPPEYRMAAPVEMCFGDGGERVGVRAGTPTHAEFAALAERLLGEVKAAREAGPDGPDA